MTAGAVHRRLSWLRLVGAQFGFILDSGLWIELMGGVVALLSLAVVLMALISSSPPGALLPARFMVNESLPLGMLLVVAFISAWPMLLWRGEPPGRRRVHWPLPTPRGTHDLARVAAGGIWVLLVAALVGIVRALSLSGPSHGPLAVYAGFVFGQITMYCLTSIPAVLTVRPVRWLYGIVAAYALLMVILPSRQGDIVGAPFYRFLTATGVATLEDAAIYETLVIADSSAIRLPASADSIAKTTAAPGAARLVDQAPAVPALPSATDMDSSITALSRDYGASMFFNRSTTLAATLRLAGAIAILLFISASRHER